MSGCIAVSATDPDWEEWEEMTGLGESPWFLAFAGLARAIMGYAARRQHFCTMAALERHWYAGDGTGLRSWVLAAAIALLLTQALAFVGRSTSDSFYLTELPLAGAILGGLMFGFGMALVGTCGFGALVRTGGGSLRSVVVLVMLGLSAMAAQRGLIAQLRVASSTIWRSTCPLPATSRSARSFPR